MKYILNATIDIMSLGDDEGAVLYDSTTENTFVLDEVAADILSCFGEANDWNAAVDSLAQMYGEERHIVEQDSKEFFEQLIQEKIIIEVNT